MSASSDRCWPHLMISIFRIPDPELGILSPRFLRLNPLNQGFSIQRYIWQGDCLATLRRAQIKLAGTAATQENQCRARQQTKAILLRFYAVVGWTVTIR